MIQNHLLTMSGRRSHALFKEDAEHTLILPADCHFSTPIIRDAHRTIHSGGQLPLATLRRQYWIVNGQAAVIKGNQIMYCVLTTCSTSAHSVKAV